MKIAADLMCDINSVAQSCFDGRVRGYEVQEWCDDRKRSIALAIDEHTAALRAGVPDGHVMLPGGKVVKVLARKSLLGTSPVLWPMTKDGCAIVPGCTIYFKSGVNAAVLAVWFDHTLDMQSHDENGIPENNWKRLRYDGDAYSTRDAAEAARSKG